MSHRPPKDLDSAAKKRWKELILSVDPDTDLEMLGNYCRTHSSLLAIRSEKAKQMAAGKFQTMVAGRDKTKVLNPLLREENRLVASLNKMLQTLGLASSRDSKKGKRPLPSPRPAWAVPGTEEPRWGWAIEAALCGYYPDGTMSEDHPDHPNFKRRLM